MKLISDPNLIENKIQEDVNRGRFEHALNQIIDLCTELVNEPMVCGSVFGSRKLDGLCSAIGAKALETLKSKDDSPTPTPTNNDRIAIIATEAYKTGGHTAVIKDLISAYSRREIIIIIVDTLYTANHEKIRSLFPEEDIRFAPKHMGPFERLVWLEKLLLQLSPKRTFVFNQMEDAVTVAALQPAIPTEFHYYHHCDHRFALGVFAPCRYHIDFRQQGFENCRYGLGIDNNVLVRLTTNDITGGARRSNFQSSGSLRTCTSGSYKLEQPYLFSLVDVLPQVLKITKGSHIHIGQISQNFKAALSLTLKEAEIEEDRFILLDYVENLSAAFHQFEVDIYLDSFPICGCRSVVEAMGAGIPTIVHKNYKSPLLSNKNLVYPEALCWDRPEDLYCMLASVDMDFLIDQSNWARKFYEANHTSGCFADTIINLEQNLFIAPPFSGLPYKRDDYLEFLEVRQLQAQRDRPRNSPEKDEAQSLLTALKALLHVWRKAKLEKRVLSEVLYAQAAAWAADQERSLVSTHDKLQPKTSPLKEFRINGQR